MNIAKKLYDLYQEFNTLDDFVYNKLRENSLSENVDYHIIIPNCAIYFYTPFENIGELDDGIPINYVNEYHVMDNIGFYFSEELVNNHQDLIKKIKEIFTAKEE